MEAQQRSLKVSVMGKSYQITTDEPEAQVAAAAQLVDRLMKHAAQSAPLMSEIKWAVLVSLQLAAELTKKGNDLAQVTHKTEALEAMLDAVLQAHTSKD